MERLQSKKHINVLHSGSQTFFFTADQASHDENLCALKEAAKKENFTFNENKCQYNRSQIQLLGHLVGIELN